MNWVDPYLFYVVTAACIGLAFVVHPAIAVSLWLTFSFVTFLKERP